MRDGDVKEERDRSREGKREGEGVGNRNLRHITTAGEVFLFSMKGFSVHKR